jgi:hypothetical protein
VVGRLCGVKVITRKDNGCEAPPAIPDPNEKTRRVLSKRYGCDVEVDTVAYAHTPVYHRDITWSDVAVSLFDDEILDDGDHLTIIEPLDMDDDENVEVYFTSLDDDEEE